MGFGPYSSGFLRGRPYPWGNGWGNRPRASDPLGECYPDRQMFRAVYRQIARFLNWVNRTGSGSSASQATREAADYRRDVQARSGSDLGSYWGP